MRTLKEADRNREYDTNVRIAEERLALAHPTVVVRITELEAKVERLTDEHHAALAAADDLRKVLMLAWVDYDDHQAEVERLTRAFVLSEQARDDAADLHRAEAERLKAREKELKRLLTTLADKADALAWSVNSSMLDGDIRQVRAALAAAEKGGGTEDDAR